MGAYPDTVQAGGKLLTIAEEKRDATSTTMDTADVDGEDDTARLAGVSKRIISGPLRDGFPDLAGELPQIKCNRSLC